MNLTEKFQQRISSFEIDFQEKLEKLQQIAIKNSGVSPVWASSCLIRLFGLMDLIIDIEEFTPIASRRYSEDLDHLVALGKMSYTYINLLSLLHDFLDNMGFALGVLYLNKNVEDFKAKSFHSLFNNDGNLISTAYSNEILMYLQQIFDNAKKFTNFDNINKHKFFAGVGDVYVPEEFIRNNPNLTANMGDFLRYGMISIDTALKDSLFIKKYLLIPIICLSINISDELHMKQIK